MTRMSRTERDALCDLALQLGEGEPTLCGDWTVKDLVVHLLVRERSPAAAGIVVKPLSRLTDLETRRMSKQDFGVLVEKLRAGPPVWTPYAVPKVDELFNTLEYFVHHEDIRRAQPDWEPRDLPVTQQKQLWALARTAAKALVRRAPSGLAIENAATGSRVVLKAAPEQVVVHGLPSEIVMFVFGRQEHARVELLGSDEAVTALRGASLGV